VDRRPTTTQPVAPISHTTHDAEPAVRWWESFHDPQLNSLIERAVRQNLGIRQAESRIRAARAQRGVVATNLFPFVNASAGYQHARGSNNITIPPGAFGGGSTAPGDPPNPGSVGSTAPLGGPQSPLGLGGLPGVETNIYQAGFDAAWELDVFGGTRRAMEGADADTAAAIEDRRATVVSLMAEVARTYIELRGYQREQAIAEQNLAVQQQTMDIVNDKRKAGMITQLDVARQASQLASTAATLPALEAQIRQSIHALGTLLSDDPDALTAELSASAPIPPIPPEVPVGLPSDLLRRRPDIRRAERQLASATARVGVATADLYPRFSITGSMGLDATHLHNLPEWASRYFVISPGVSWPVFDAGRIGNNIKAQKEAVELDLAAFHQTILQALREVADAISNYRLEQIRRQSLVEAVNASQDAVNVARDQYKQGVTDFLTVLDAQRSLFAAQQALAESDRAVVVDLVAIYKSLGGGWEEDAAPKGASNDTAHAQARATAAPVVRAD
jgi:NodT family efflux transporter outer membrane factor (OMF) lipoprotein